MVNKTPLIMLLIVAVALGMLFVLSNKSSTSKTSSTILQAGTNGPSNTNLSTSTRSFYLGLVPTPANSPNSSFADITNGYEETGKLADIGMVWVANEGIGEAVLLNQTRVITAMRVYGLKPFVTLNFATIEQGSGGLVYAIDAPQGIAPNLSDSGFRTAWINEAKTIAQEFHPDYLSLGNEVNDYFYSHPGDLSAYLSLVGEASAAIHKVSPNTKVLVVFSYGHLVETNQLSMLQKFNNSGIDLIGLTTYPYQNFSTPEMIPSNYYTQVSQYTNLPVAFTEIGWPSAAPSSQVMQADFLTTFLTLTKGLNIEMVNWLFLHDTIVGGIAGEISNQSTATIALMNANNTTKEVYTAWGCIKESAIKKITNACCLSHPRDFNLFCH